tara:strand:+ start:15745 stop:16062 length:318 start_codon:yes stop_codon:yes gene_type:complete
VGKQPKKVRNKTRMNLFEYFVRNPLDKRVRRAVKVYTKQFSTQQHEEMDRAEIVALLEVIKMIPTSKKARKKLKKFENILDINNLDKLSCNEVDELRTMLDRMVL